MTRPQLELLEFSAPLFAGDRPDTQIRAPFPSAPGSPESEAAADTVSRLKRHVDYDAILNTLGASDNPLSRDDLHEATGIVVSTLCPCLIELEAALLVQKLKGACLSRAKPTLHVNGYRLTDAALVRIAGAA